MTLNVKKHIWFAFFLVTIMLHKSIFTQDYENTTNCEIYVAGITKNLQIYDEDTKKWVNVEEGECLVFGSKLKTNIGEFAILKHKESNSLWINELTILTLEESKFANSINQLNLEKGKIILHLPKVDKNSFYVHTPSAVAGVRGTEFSVEIDKDENTTVEILDGEINVSNDVEEKNIEAGYSVKVMQNKSIKDFSILNKEEIIRRYLKIKEKIKEKDKKMLQLRIRKKLIEKMKNKEQLKEKHYQNLPNWKKNILKKKWQQLDEGQKEKIKEKWQQIDEEKKEKIKEKLKKRKK